MQTPPATARSAPPVDKASSSAFRQFLDARQTGKTRRLLNAPAPKPIAPTAERLIKPDRPKRTEAGHYRAPPPIERLRDQGKLDPTSPRTNEAMFTAAGTLATSFYNAGLSEHVKAQDLMGVGGGATTAASYMPVSEFAAHHRNKFQAACKSMGWYEVYPTRGAGRLVVDVICREHSLRDASAVYFPGTRLEAAQLAAMDRLREGLFILTRHWKLI